MADMTDIIDKQAHYLGGSVLLAPLGDLTGLPLDQLNFLACQFVALIAAQPFRVFFGPHKTSATTRHIVEIILGVTLTIFCYGKQIWLLLAQSAVCIMMMRILHPGLMEKTVLVLALGILCASHIYRQIYDYGGYTLDITGPLMINTQRMSSIAFSMADAVVKDEEKLTSGQKAQVIRKMPTLLEFTSYIFCFHTAFCGPFTFYNDYIDFIEGKNIHSSCKQNGKTRCSSYNENVAPYGVNGTIDTLEHVFIMPSPYEVVVTKLSAAMLCSIVVIFIQPKLPVSYISDNEFLQIGLIQKTAYLILCTSMMRHRYYVAWKIAEAVNINAGLGFSGYDENDKPKFDLINNVNIMELETCTSLKVLIDSWNITTTHWLRHVVYERVPKAVALPAVFAFSSLWHGFYPGYYMMFGTGAIYIYTSRLVRRNIRPHFQTSDRLAQLYDVITIVTTRITVGYMTFPFVVLEFMPCLRAYMAMYFWGHIAAFLAIALFCIYPIPKPAAKPQ